MRKENHPRNGSHSTAANYDMTSSMFLGSALLLFNSRGFRQASELATSIFMSPPGDTSSGFPMQLGNFRVNLEFSEHIKKEKRSAYCFSFF